MVDDAGATAGRSKVVLAAVVALTAVLLVVAPVIRAGTPPLASLLLQWFAIALLFSLAWAPAWLRQFGLPERVLLLSLVVLPLLHLVPLPGLPLEMLPGREQFAAANALAHGGAETGVTRISVAPRSTWAATLAVLVPLSIFLAARYLAPAQLWKLMGIMLTVAALEAILGLVQFGGGRDSPWYFNMENVHFGSAVGTYASRNNFVGFMYLSLMLSLAMFMATIGRYRGHAKHKNLRERLLYYASPQGHRALLYGALSLLFLLAVIFSQSRGGIGAAMLGIVVASIAFSRRIGGSNVYGITGTIASIVVALAIVIGLGPVLDRFSVEGTVENGRWIIWDGAIDGIRQFFPFGSGAGTFRDTFPAFQALEHAESTVNRAHNNYLEWAYTCGLPGILLIVALLTFYGLRWRAVWKAGEWGEFRYLQVGAGIGMGLMLLHDVLDYNLMIPANQVYFAFCAGLFFYPYTEPVKTRKRKSRDPRTRAPENGLKPRLQTVDGTPARNPFMDD